MAKRASRIDETVTVSADPPSSRKQSPPAEERFAQELAFLKAFDSSARPDGWILSPQAVVTFVCGSRGETLRLPKGSDAGNVPESLVISEKFVGERSLVERCVVTLAGERGLLEIAHAFEQAAGFTAQPASRPPAAL